MARCLHVWRKCFECFLCFSHCHPTQSTHTPRHCNMKYEKELWIYLTVRIWLSQCPLFMHFVVETTSLSAKQHPCQENIIIIIKKHTIIDRKNKIKIFFWFLWKPVNRDCQRYDIMAIKPENEVSQKGFKFWLRQL